MPRKRTDDTPKGGETIIESPMEQVVHESMMPYAEYVILERALPRVEDGLKPVQRRILYTMHEIGLTPDKPHKKCARVVGDCLGKYHPHGDVSVYDALVRMAQDFNMRATLVDGHGNFGSIDGDRAAAIRYTECRMTPAALELLDGIDKNTVDFSLNFDDSLKEPDMLPGGFPNLLVNGASGIAVGLATNIPPHNLGEAIDCVIAQIDKPDISVGELISVLKGPDFPTGGVIVGGDDMASVYETGRGRVIVRAKTHMEDGQSGRKLIVIDELPYQVNKAALLSAVLKLSETRRDALSGIYDIRDESDRAGMRAVIEIKKDADPARVLGALFRYSDLQSSFGVNMVAIAGGRPLTLGIKQINAYYIEHRKNVTTRAARHELDGALARAHVLDGLIMAVNNIDEVIRIIRASATPKEAKERLIARFKFTEAQAQAILDLRLQRLTGLEITALKKELGDLEKRIAQLEAILGSEKRLLKVIKDQLAQVKERHATPRRTAFGIVTDDYEPEPDDKPALPAQVTLMQNGCFKRFAPKAGLSVDDLNGPVRHTLTVTTAHKLLVFTDQGSCYTLSADQIPDCKPKDRGVAYTGLLAGLRENERPVAMLAAASQDDPQAERHDLLFITAQGMIKRAAATEYGSRKGKAAALTLKGDDTLVCVLLDDNRGHGEKGGHTLMLVSQKGMAIHMRPDEVPRMGRAAAGVKGMALDADDAVLDAFLARPKDELALVSDRGYIKRTLLVDYDIQKRNGKGIKAFPFTKNGANGQRLAGCVRLGAGDMGKRLYIEQKSGLVTALSPMEVMVEGRASKGSPCLVALMEDVVTSMSLQD